MSCVAPLPCEEPWGKTVASMTRNSGESGRDSQQKAGIMLAGDWCAKKSDNEFGWFQSLIGKNICRFIQWAEMLWNKKAVWYLNILSPNSVVPALKHWHAQQWDTVNLNNRCIGGKRATFQWLCCFWYKSRYHDTNIPANFLSIPSSVPWTSLNNNIKILLTCPHW